MRPTTDATSPTVRPPTAPTLTALALFLAGCAVEPVPVSPPAAPVSPPPPAVAQCQVGPAQAYVGRRMAPSTPEAARIASGSASVRVLGPGTAATMDFRPDRLNLLTDARNTVTGVRCG